MQEADRINLHPGFSAPLLPLGFRCNRLAEDVFSVLY